MRLFYIISLLLLPACAVAQTRTANHKTAIQAEATKMGKALVSKDYENFVKTTYPKAVEWTEGGKEALKKELSSQITTMEKDGASIARVWPGQAGDIIDTAQELQSTIPQYMEIVLPEGTVKSETTLIAISQNKGKSWYFIDVAGKSLQQIREVFPNISAKLVVPVAPEPVFTPNK